jgi:allantoinase
MPAKRAHGMDQNFYLWSPIVTRPVLRWLDDARVALAVIVNLEHWDWEVPASTPVAVSPMGGPEGLWSGNQPQFPDIGGYGNHEYGNRVGIFRILAVLDKYGITPTLALDKGWPIIIRRSSRRARTAAQSSSRTGCRAAASSISTCPKRRSANISVPRSRRSSRRPARARSAGPAPISRRRRTTLDLLAAEGIRYVCDWGNDEQPYRMTPKTGELYSLGVNAYLDDNYIHLHGRRTINEVNLLWREWFDGLYADGAATGRMMVLHLHPWIMGQPWRIRHLDEVLGHICARQGVWKATGREIIDWFKAHAS